MLRSAAGHCLRVKAVPARAESRQDFEGSQRDCPASHTVQDDRWLQSQSRAAVVQLHVCELDVSRGPSLGARKVQSLPRTRMAPATGPRIPTCRPRP